MMRVAMASFLVLFIAGAVMAVAPHAHANGLPQVIKLERMPGVSNFGPDDAEGVLEFSFAERYARAQVKNLVPEPGYTYEGWMLNESGGTYELGDFDIDQAGIGSLESSFPGLDSYEYNQFVVAARSASTPEGEMPKDIAIGGEFTIVDDETGGSASDDARPANNLPEELPRTGQSEGGPLLDPIAGALLAMSGTGLAIMVVSNARKRRRSPGD